MNANINLPKEFINRIKIQLKDEYEDFLSSYDKESLRSLRLNNLKIDKSSFVLSNPWKFDESMCVPWCEEAFYFRDEDIEDGQLLPGKHPLHAAGAYYIQEASAMSPVKALDIKEGDRVLDLCAAPGGKSSQIASYLGESGILISNEPNKQRADILSENMERMGVSNSLVISHEPWDIDKTFEGFFNKILVDAPCSGEGMFRKNPEAVKEWSEDNVLMCAKRQRDILDSAIRMLSEGGRLVYSTCTFSEEENELNAEYVTNTYPDMHCIKMRRIWPHKDKGEGHFYAVFVKKDDTKEAVMDPLFPARWYEKGVNPRNFKEYLEFEKENLKDCSIRRLYEKEGYQFFAFRDELYLLPKFCPSLKGLRVLRSGLHLGTLKKGRFEPSHALALYLKKDEAVKSLELSESEAVSYQRGETITTKEGKGWYLLCINGISLGWGKLTGTTMKNHYPKGLRIFT